MDTLRHDLAFDLYAVGRKIDANVRMLNAYNDAMERKRKVADEKILVHLIQHVNAIKTDVDLQIIELQSQIDVTKKHSEETLRATVVLLLTLASLIWLFISV